MPERVAIGLGRLGPGKSIVSNDKSGPAMPVKVNYTSSCILGIFQKSVNFVEAMHAMTVKKNFAYLGHS